ncbi:MAG: CoA transferase [Pseudomonadales bacterium]|nr:CoA transferase [Pseudomonadales bacterium]
MFKLLSGIRVIDLTTVVLGPYATQIIADLGADVIKVEPPEGDVFRAARPGRLDDVGAGFQNSNRNKRSVVVDLKSNEGQEQLTELVRDADVVVHNMRLRSATNLGADYETLRTVNSQLIYCFSPGFGSTGPDADAPAYDDIIQARSGLADLNKDADGAPQFVRTIACDKVVGLHLAIAMLGGIAYRERHQTGVCIEAPMLESMTSFLMAEHLAGHSFTPPEGELGYDRLMTKHRKPHKTLDGYIAILPYSTRHWVRFFTACDNAPLAQDERVTNPILRSQHIDWLYQEISSLAATKSTAGWLQLLSQEDIPCAPINSLDDLFADEHLQAVNLFQKLNSDKLGSICQIRSPFVVDGETFDQPRANTVAPSLGEHTTELLSRQ